MYGWLSGWLYEYGISLLIPLMIWAAPRLVNSQSLALSVPLEANGCNMTPGEGVQAKPVVSTETSSSRTGLEEGKEEARNEEEVMDESADLVFDEVIENGSEPEVKQVSGGDDSQVTERVASPTLAPTAKVLMGNSGDEELHRLVNSYRSIQGKPALAQHKELCAVALMRVGDISADFNHEGFVERMEEIGYTATAENIWYGEPFSYEGALSSWDQSGGHKANLLGEWTVGCGASKGGYTVYLFMR